jgi:hypothetical protein
MSREAVQIGRATCPGWRTGEGERETGRGKTQPVSALENAYDK